MSKGLSRTISCLIFTVGMIIIATAQAGTSETESGVAEYILSSINSGNVFLLILGLLLVGLVINLTPCVYPMVPITIVFFANQAGENRKARVALGFAYMVGIAITYGLVGGIAASLGTAFGALFTKIWFLYGVAAIMIGLSLSMFGLYQIGIPPFISKYLRGRSGLIGAFIMGLFVGVSTAPCSGPLLVAVFAEIAKLQDTFLGIALFTLVGIGLGLPYIVLAAFASGIKSLPKAGAWTETVEIILGFVVMGIGVHYLLLALPGVLTQGRMHYIWAGYYLLAALYLAIIKRHSVSQLQTVIRSIAIAAFGILSGMCLERESFETFKAQREQMKFKIDWKDFTAESFEQAKKSGKPILIDVWADWCKICKEIDAKVFDQPEAIEALQKVELLIIDWSARKHKDIEAYMEYTQELFKMPGPPYFIFMRPDGKIISEGATLRDVQDLKNKLVKIGVKL